MSDVLALIPARAGSKGIPNKNFRELAGRSPLNRAIDVARDTCHDWIVSSDVDWAAHERVCMETPAWVRGQWLLRPPELAQDDTPMQAVIEHALAAIPGPPEQIVVLLQPTQPLRQPKHIQQAIELLRTTSADSVVSVLELPRAYSPDLVCEIEASGRLAGWEREYVGTYEPLRRQDTRIAYARDGTVYAFWRRTWLTYRGMYGYNCRPLIIPPEETCPLDTLADWAAAERRLRATS